MKRQSNSRTGALTVEVALCIPLILFVFFGCYEMARANMILHATESAAYEGARVGIVPGATEAKIEAATGRILRSVGVSDFQVRVTPAVLQRDTPEVEVEVLVPLRRNLSIPSMFFEDPTFRGSTTLSREVQ